ncbi:hypothetical protein QCF01_19350, partial [Staphylococcus aureus]|nr:hypothetical protein [Staphylococcus aureus]
YSRLAAAAPLGYGPGGLDDAALHGFASIHEAHIAWFVHSTHNIVLSLLITGGYPYLAIMSLLVVALLFPYFRRAHRLREPVVVALVAALAVFVLLVLLRKPLADWFWDEPQIEQLLVEGDRALAAGRLSAADGSGARERYQAVLALDGDRPQARQGLARTAAAALQQAR